jgi:hypothetical protein
MLYSSCRKAVKTLQLFPHKVHVIQQLLAPDCEKHNYCEWLSAKVGVDSQVLYMTLSSDEAWFHLAHYANSQNTCIWLTENPHGAHETPFHPDKIEVWCATACHGMVGPIFFEKSINLGCYTVIVHKFLGLHTKKQIARAWFQQDSTTCHTAKVSMCNLSLLFGF